VKFLIFIGLLAGFSVYAQNDAVKGGDSEYVAARNSAGEKYISRGCATDLQKLSLWLAATDPIFSKNKICNPTVTANPVRNEKGYQVTVKSSAPGSKPLIFEFGDKSNHPCDIQAQQQFKVNGTAYVNTFNGKLDTQENAKKTERAQDAL
jgi:hypothetical protein